MKNFSEFVCLLLLIFVCENARADITLEKYRSYKKLPQGEKNLGIYVTGVGRGISWYNLMLEAKDMPKLFCLPKNLSLDQGIIESLLDQEIRASVSGIKYKDDDFIELIMLEAFVGRFPCASGAD